MKNIEEQAMYLVRQGIDRTQSRMLSAGSICFLLLIGGCTTDPMKTFVIFTTEDGSYSTADVLDVEGDIVHFDAVDESLIWAATAQRFTGGFSVEGDRIGSSGTYQVRFGTEDGDPFAYFTETATGTVCDIDVADSRLSISPTNEPVPAT